MTKGTRWKETLNMARQLPYLTEELKEEDVHHVSMRANYIKAMTPCLLLCTTRILFENAFHDTP